MGPLLLPAALLAQTVWFTQTAQAQDCADPSAPCGEAPIPGARPPAVRAYTEEALQENPQVRAADSDTQAAFARAEHARSLVPPTLSASAFVQPIETRVGPQRGRVSVQQALPGPGTRTSRRDVAVATARSTGARALAVRLDVGAQVDAAYWELWVARTTREVHIQHLAVLDQLAETLQARVAIGDASLADLQQLDLSRALLKDRIASMVAHEDRAAAQLRSLVARPPGAEVPTPDRPSPPTVPVQSVFSLIETASKHPARQAITHDSEQASAAVRLARASRRPGLIVGVDWIPTGPAPDPTTQGSGTDAVAVGLGLTLPVWIRAGNAQVAAATHTQNTVQHHQEAFDDETARRVQDLTARVRDTARRVRLLDTTLLPQAEAMRTSLLGAYTAGKAGLAQVLLAQQTVLTLKVESLEVQADHARAWAALEATCAQTLERTPVEASP